MDVLSDILDVLQLRGTLYFRTAFTPPWSVAVPPYARVARFHLVAQGRCFARVERNEPVELGPGDLIVIPDGAAHILSDTADREPLTLDDVIQRAGFDGEGVLAFGGAAPPEAETKLICGHMNFSQNASHPLLSALPDYLIVSAELRAKSPLLDELMRLIVRQMFSAQPGMNASVIRLTEALFIEVVRACADQDSQLHRLIEAMSDPKIGRALSLMHRDVDKGWTIDGVAREAGMSRSRFAEKFQETLGCSPMSYLTDLRLQKAINMLSDTNDSIQTVAGRVGYRSPAAFSRAFAKRFGHTPRQTRQAAN